MEHFFRLVLLCGVYIVPLHFMDIEDKFIIQVTGVIGIVVAYFLALFIMKKLKKRNEGKEKNNA
ncbi:MAG: hypothetical protein MJZ52_06130 [Bacteroidales bacterium]|nr:hypothetical protein [Bacteroidales bacterium]